MATTQHEAGFVSEDEHLHASQQKIAGRVALCGAGAITQPVSGRFDTDDARACPDCLGLVSAA